MRGCRYASLLRSQTLIFLSFRLILIFFMPVVFAYDDCSSRRIGRAHRFIKTSHCICLNKSSSASIPQILCLLGRWSVSVACAENGSIRGAFFSFALCTGSHLWVRHCLCGPHVRILYSGLNVELRNLQGGKTQTALPLNKLTTVLYNQVVALCNRWVSHAFVSTDDTLKRMAQWPHWMATLSWTAVQQQHSFPCVSLTKAGETRLCALPWMLANEHVGFNAAQPLWRGGGEIVGVEVQYWAQDLTQRQVVPNHQSAGEESRQQTCW